MPDFRANARKPSGAAEARQPIFTLKIAVASIRANNEDES